MIEEKSDKNSVAFKISGNGFFNQRKFSEALGAYNKALNFAISKENLSLAYANRSAVYLEINEYQKSLQNIQWALENEYPAEKVQKLLDRKMKCEEMMKKVSANSDKDAKGFFKLSYPANPKIPFIVDGLEVRMTEKMGRGIFTTRDLNPGDIISIEEPVVPALSPNSKYNLCCNCLSSNLYNLIPCLKTASLMFCSIECRDEIYAKVRAENFVCLISGDLNLSVYTHLLSNFDFAFGGRKNLVKFAKQIDVNKWIKTLFDFDFSNPNDPEYNKNALKSILSFTSQNAYKVFEQMELKGFDKFMKDVKAHPALRNLLLHTVVAWRSSVLVHIGLKFKKLSDPIADFTFLRETATSSFRFGLLSPLMNYSCFPNVHRIITNNRVYLYITRPVKAGDELFRVSTSLEFLHEPVQKRREFFHENTYFTCQCYYCENDLHAHSLPKCHLPCPTDGFYDNTEYTLRQKIMRNFEFIKQYEERCPQGSFESLTLNILNMKLISLLSAQIE